MDAKATAELQNIENATNSLQQMLKAQAQENAQGLVNRAIMPFLPQDQKDQVARAQSLAQINQAFTTAESTIAYLQSSGMLSEAQATAMRNSMQPYDQTARESYVDNHMAAKRKARENEENRARLAEIDRERDMQTSYRRLADQLDPVQQQIAAQEKLERDNRHWQKAIAPRQRERDDMLRLIKKYDDKDAWLAEQLNDPGLSAEQRSKFENQRTRNQKRRNKIEQRYRIQSSPAGFSDDIRELHNIFANMGTQSSGDQLINQYEQMQEAQAIAQKKLDEMKSRLRALNAKAQAASNSQGPQLSDAEQNE